MPTERLLQNMQKVYSHDLPNQMVALASLVQLLEAEESARLSSEGREYLRRLHSATRKASDMVRFSREMGRLYSTQPRREKIMLPTLGRELQGEFRHLYPRIEFSFDWQWLAPVIVGDAKTFVGAILEISGCFLAGRAGPCAVSAIARPLGSGTELEFFLETGAAAVPEGLTPPPSRCNPQMLAQRMEIILAREWLDLSSASVEFTLPGSGGVRFVISVPGR